ncbi:OmpA family protein [Kaistella sp. 97-N-M2]|uniref:OmpA family protein n=1 Tax=Kaistella sp. 97-N-M2 TaxID=2908645 RepID=UPI001F24680F|nr:OmpA family protein [Kaistella sp. 97-N-M2]UJF29181.1 OmpA family protein [Kaistella sp. 97-N-M2]
MKIFNKTNIAALFISTSFLMTSCEAVKNSNNQQKGTVIGASAGAVLGGILGNNIGKGKNAPLGAVLGGVVGGIAGNVIGNKMDKQAKEIKETLPGAEVERVGEGIKVTLKENMVNFAFNSSALTEAGKANLNKLATVLANNPDTNINIYGYTDSKGTDSYNLSLSDRRAAAVRAYLSSQGVASSRMNTMGMGEADPVASNDTDAGRAQNRRVEFAITANEDMINDAKTAQ